MQLLPHLNSIISAVDEVHRRVGHAGGCFDLRAALGHLPGFLVDVVDWLPAGTRGAMTRRDGCFAIAVSRALPRVARRFTVAHEIGHALLHHGHLGRCRVSPRAEPLVERQASFFAAELLAPLWAVERALPAEWRARPLPSRLPAALVAEVASAVDVSRTVARIQLEALGAVQRTQAGRAEGCAASERRHPENARDERFNRGS